jgi:hypothetical protein
LAKQLLTFNGIQAIVVAGSVARGYADEYSDVEIPIFWERLPEDATRHAIVNTLHAEFLYEYDGPAREDQLLIDGLQVDLWHITRQHQKEVIESVLRGQTLDLGGLNALDTLRSCIPLYGHELVESWKRRAQEYPDELAKQIVQEHLASFGTADLFIQAQRDNPTAFYAQLSFLQQEVFLVLLALNRRYFPTFKWLYQVLESMPVKPEAISQRFRRAYEIPYADALADTKRILEETLPLVERQFPQMDITPVYRRLAYVRAAHTNIG